METPDYISLKTVCRKTKWPLRQVVELLCDIELLSTPNKIPTYFSIYHQLVKTSGTQTTIYLWRAELFDVLKNKQNIEPSFFKASLLHLKYMDLLKSFDNLPFNLSPEIKSSVYPGSIEFHKFCELLKKEEQLVIYQFCKIIITYQQEELIAQEPQEVFKSRIVPTLQTILLEDMTMAKHHQNNLISSTSKIL